MSHAPSPANYHYIYERLQAQYGAALPSLTILDFGCGEGGLVEYLRAQGLNAVGADPYDDRYGVWQQDKPYLHRIENRSLPFADGHFDCVVSNQVFEHIDDYHGELAEIRRVLKADGLFLALFPTLETAYEVHSGIWFAYYFKKFPALLRGWLWVWRKTGAGLWHHDYSAAKWSAVMRDIITKECHYKPMRRIKADWLAVFGHAPKTYMADYLRFRLRQARFAGLARVIPRPLLALITLVRAGIVVEVKK